MQVNVRCFAILRELAADRVSLELADGATLSDAWDALQEQFPAVARYLGQATDRPTPPPGPVKT